MLLLINKKYGKKKDQKGLSLIEAAMTLAVAATVTAAVMFYYRAASDSNKSQSSISLVMSATSAINGLYMGRSDYTGLTSSVLVNSSAIPDSYKNGTTITNPFGGSLTVGTPAGSNGGGFGYFLKLDGLPKSACISLATLNLGTSAKGYGINTTNPANVTFTGSSVGGNGHVSTTSITPAVAAENCTSDENNSITYFMK
mgnify:CR=1 FL=1